jgi:hypothetical protein
MLVSCSSNVRNDDNGNGNGNSPEIPNEAELLPSSPPNPISSDRNLIFISDVPGEGGLTLIPDEETEIVTKLRTLVNRFPRILFPSDVIEIDVSDLVWLHQDYNNSIGPPPAEWVCADRAAELREIYNWEGVYNAGTLDYIFNDIFSKAAVNIIPVYSQYVTEDGIVGYENFEVLNYRLILKEQVISDDVIELYFSHFHTTWDGFTQNAECDEIIGWWDEAGGMFFEDMLNLLEVIRYTFVYEDGKYKILNVEAVN